MFDFIDDILNADWSQVAIYGLAEQGFVFLVGMTAILASLGVVLCSSPIYSALFLIGNMICLALLFLSYNAEFLAAVQVVVYAGAVMILFLFIIALLGAKKEELKLTEVTFEKFVAGNFVFLLFAELLMAMRVGETKPVERGITPEVIAEVGNAKAIGIELFSRHLVSFELASTLLLVATVGIVCLAKFNYQSVKKRTRL